MRYTQKGVEERAKRLGLVLSMWAPGDRYGTRYEFFAYCGKSGGLYRSYGVYCGTTEAMHFLNGFEAALRHATNVSECRKMDREQEERYAEAVETLNAPE